MKAKKCTFRNKGKTAAYKPLQRFCFFMSRLVCVHRHQKQICKYVERNKASCTCFDIVFLEEIYLFIGYNVLCMQGEFPSSLTELATCGFKEGLLKILVNFTFNAGQ